MGNTLVDEPVPETLSQPPTGDRATLDDIVPGERRGPSPTLPDGPELPVAGARRGPSPTLPDGLPGSSVSSPSAGSGPQRLPASGSPVIAPSAGSGPQILPAPGSSEGSPSAGSGPQILPASGAPAGSQAASGPGPGMAAGKAGASPAPPPLAHPKGGPGAGLLAQLPAMPMPSGSGSGSSSFLPLAPSPHPLPTPDLVPVPVPVAAPARISSAAPVAAPARALAAPVLAEHAPSIVASGPAVAITAAAGAPQRLPAGSRTIVGVAPPPPPLGTDGASAPPQGGSFKPPGQTSEPDPNDATVPEGEGLRPTMTDAAAEAANDGATGPAATSASAPKRGARRWVALVFAGLGLLAIVGVVVGYFVLFRYTPLAHRHIPAGTNLAVRAELRAIGTFGPVRKNLWPVLFDRPSRKTPGKTLAERVAAETGINPTLDLREVIVATVDTRSWVVLVGGNFKSGKFLPGMEKVLRDEGLGEWRKAGELLVGPGGVAMAQAEDGTLLLGTESEIVTAALPPSEEYKRVDVPSEGALSFAVSKEAWEEIARDTGAFGAGGALRKIRHVKGTLLLGDEPSVTLDVEPKGGESADALAGEVSTFLGQLRLGLVLFPDQMGEKTALSSALATSENGHVMVRAAWPLEGLDRACAKLAGWVGPP